VKTALRSPRILALAAVGGALLAAAAVWFLLVSPQRSTTTELDGQIAALEGQLAQRLAAARPRPQKLTVRASDYYRLSKAMPDQTDMPGIVLELSRLASGAGVRFSSITTGTPVPGAGFYAVQPLDVVVQGRFGDISRFLQRMRGLVTVRGGRLDARGRLFLVDQVAFTQGAKGFPQVEASLKLSAFVFSGAANGASVPADGTAPGVAAEIPVSSPPAAGATP
jgi:hypothetical protein